MSWVDCLYFWVDLESFWCLWSLFWTQSDSSENITSSPLEQTSNPKNFILEVHLLEMEQESVQGQLKRPQVASPSFKPVDVPQRPQTSTPQDDLRPILPPLPSRALINPVPPPKLTFIEQPTESKFVISVFIPPFDHSQILLEMRIDNGDWQPCQLSENGNISLSTNSTTYFRSRVLISHKTKFSGEVSKGKSFLIPKNLKSQK